MGEGEGGEEDRLTSLTADAHWSTHLRRCCRAEAQHFGVRQPLPVSRHPAHEMEAIELQDAVGRTNPDIAVWRLRDRLGRAVEGAVLHPPCGMAVL